MTSRVDPERPWILTPESEAERHERELAERLERLKRERAELERPRRVFVLGGYGLRLERP